MLPFLKPKRMAATILESRNAAGQQKQENKPSEDLMPIAESILSAVGAKDAERLAIELQKLMDKIAAADAKQDAAEEKSELFDNE